MLLDGGASDDDVQQLLVRNPARLLRRTAGQDAAA